MQVHITLLLNLKFERLKNKNNNRLFTLSGYNTCNTQCVIARNTKPALGLTVSKFQTIQSRIIENENYIIDVSTLLLGFQVQSLKNSQIRDVKQSWNKFCETSLHIFYYINVLNMMRIPNLSGTFYYGPNVRGEYNANYATRNVNLINVQNGSET